MIVVVSPHLDDAVLSLGEWIANQNGGVEVVTVFAGAPADSPAAQELLARRRLEDVAALRAIDASWRHLPLLDEEYGGSAFSDILGTLAPYIASASTVLFPLGIKHPDHRRVGTVGHEIAKGGGKKFGFYEELPYRVQHPEEARDRVAELSHDLHLTLDGCGGRYAAKLHAVELYVSQIGEDIRRCVYVPERMWWVS